MRVTMQSLDGSAAAVVLVTGAGSGIGRATAIRLAASGRKVGLVGRGVRAIGEVAKEILAHGGTAVPLAADVRSMESIESAAAALVEHFGRVDALVANAAIADRLEFIEGQPENWADVIQTNVLGVMYSASAVLPHMLRQGAGHIIIVSSLAGRRTFVGQPAYVASKFATVAFADTLRKELVDRNIRVGVVEPGLVDTPLSAIGPDIHGGDVTPLDPDDCARIVQFMLDQPANCAICEVAVRPARQML